MTAPVIVEIATDTPFQITGTVLNAQPFQYEGEARDGLTARTFRISALLTATQWATLIALYDDWRDLRLLDQDSLAAVLEVPDALTPPDLGTTVDLKIGTGGAGSNIQINTLVLPTTKCYFSTPPVGEQLGAYVNTTIELVDAAQALQVLLHTERRNLERSDAQLPALGTVELGNTTIVLTEESNTRQDGPTATLTIGGTTYITGALAAHKIQQIEGYIAPDSAGNFSSLLEWYDTTIASKPASAALFPITPPVARAEARIVGGLKTTRYNVSLTLLEVK
jgi:hypothetical protein